MSLPQTCELLLWLLRDLRPSRECHEVKSTSYSPLGFSRAMAEPRCQQQPWPVEVACAARLPSWRLVLCVAEVDTMARLRLIWAGADFCFSMVGSPFRCATRVFRHCGSCARPGGMSTMLGAFGPLAPCDTLSRGSQAKLLAFGYISDDRHRRSGVFWPLVVVGLYRRGRWSFLLCSFHHRECISRTVFRGCCSNRTL